MSDHFDRGVSGVTPLGIFIDRRADPPEIYFNAVDVTLWLLDSGLPDVAEHVTKLTEEAIRRFVDGKRPSAG